MNGLEGLPDREFKRMVITVLNWLQDVLQKNENKEQNETISQYETPK